MLFIRIRCRIRCRIHCPEPSRSSWCWRPLSKQHWKSTLPEGRHITTFDTHRHDLADFFVSLNVFYQNLAPIARILFLIIQIGFAMAMNWIQHHIDIIDASSGRLAAAIRIVRAGHRVTTLEQALLLGEVIC